MRIDMLHLVATPIGNLGDITLRALEILRSVDSIASEDTRKTGILLKRNGITGHQVSFHEHNEIKVTPRLIDQLKNGRTVALVTNAGTPGIADPGFRLVAAAIAEGIPISMAPGPCGLIMALILSGLPTHSFTFRGFPPRKPGPRRRFLETDVSSPHTLIFYESPYRLKSLLTDAIAVFGDRRGALANDLTKLFEAVERGVLTDLLKVLEDKEPRGEYIVVIEGLTANGPSEDSPTKNQTP